MDSPDRVTGAMMISHQPVDRFVPIEANACQMVLATTTVIVRQHSHPQHFAVTTERRVQS